MSLRCAQGDKAGLAASPASLSGIRDIVTTARQTCPIRTWTVRRTGS
jgi:hypothetical protein